MAPADRRTATRSLGARRSRAGSGSCAATASTSRPAASPTGTRTRARYPPPAPRRADDRPRRWRPAHVSRRRVLVRGRRRPRSRDRLDDRGHGVRARSASAGRVGGEANDPLRRSRRRGASPKLQRATVLSRSRSMRDRRTDPRRPARAERRRSRVLPAGRELPARSSTRSTTRRSGWSPAATSRAPRTQPRRTGSSRGAPGSAS